MTADVELLPLPLHFSHQHDNVKKIVRNYAHDNVAHATAAKDAEIERLRAERDTVVNEAAKYAERSGRAQAEVDRLRRGNKRLAEALRGMVAYVRETAHHNAPAAAAARAALLDHDQEARNG